MCAADADGGQRERGGVGTEGVLFRNVSHK